MLRLGTNGASAAATGTASTTLEQLYEPTPSEPSLLELSGRELEEREKDVAEYNKNIMYSRRYYDEEFEYRYVNLASSNDDRHVILPKSLVKYVPSNRLMSEAEWRCIGVQQSPGWLHYMIHKPEPHVLLFRREKDYQSKYPNS